MGLPHTGQGSSLRSDSRNRNAMGAEPDGSATGLRERVGSRARGRRAADAMHSRGRQAAQRDGHVRACVGVADAT
jgi:hypothetical protein